MRGERSRDPTRPTGDLKRRPNASQKNLPSADVCVVIRSKLQKIARMRPKQFCLAYRCTSAPLRPLPRRNAIMSNTFDTGNTGFMLVATSLVMLMTPGLAFFYGGLVSRKNVLAIMIQSFVSMGVTTVIWFAFGYSLFSIGRA